MLRKKNEIKKARDKKNQTAKKNLKERNDDDDDEMVKFCEYKRRRSHCHVFSVANNW